MYSYGETGVTMYFYGITLSLLSLHSRDARLPHARGANSENFQNSREGVKFYLEIFSRRNFPEGLHPLHTPSGCPCYIGIHCLSIAGMLRLPHARGLTLKISKIRGGGVQFYLDIFPDKTFQGATPYTPLWTSLLHRNTLSSCLYIGIYCPPVSP